MRSSNHADFLDLQRDLPTTREDVAALARLRRHPPLGFDDYFRFLATFPAATLEELAARRGPHGPEPFVLP